MQLEMNNESIRREKGGDMMLKKRYLVILSVAVISILLGSLFYINITLAPKRQEPTILKDSVEITVLDWVSRRYVATSEEFDYGISLYDAIPLSLVFSFSPKQVFLNITDMYVSIVASTTQGQGRDHKLTVAVNGVATTTDGNPLSHYYLSVLTQHMTNPQVYATIEEGINTLTLSNPFWWNLQPLWQPTMIFVYKVTVFIEYEYQA